MMFRVTIVVALLMGAATWPRQTLAYRPFDGTDASVADPGTLEIELEPLGYLRDGAMKSLIAPSAVFNLGVAENWEAVLQGEHLRTIGEESGHSSLAGAGAFVQGVLRPGVRQDKPGPSIATEFGVLLPGINGEKGTGALLNGIVSQRWSWLTVHFNAQAELTREQHGDLFLTTILEGPMEWPVRPVTEIFYENEFGTARTYSGLIGAIWHVRDTLSFDVGLRGARVNDHTVNEIRAGVTFSFPVWHKDRL